MQHFKSSGGSDGGALARSLGFPKVDAMNGPTGMQLGISGDPTGYIIGYFTGDPMGIEFGTLEFCGRNIIHWLQEGLATRARKPPRGGGK